MSTADLFVESVGHRLGWTGEDDLTLHDDWELA